MSKTIAPYEIEDYFIALYDICIKNHLVCFPEPRLFTLDDWKCAGTRVLTRRLKSVYPRPLKIGDKILTLDWINPESGVGPYRILIQEA